MADDEDKTQLQPATSVSLVPRPSKRDENIAKRIALIRQELAEKSLKRLDEVMEAADLAPQLDEELAEELKAQGRQGKKLLRMASDMTVPKKDAPAYIDLKKDIAMGLMKADAAEAGNGVNITINVLAVDAPPVYEVQDADEEGGK